MSKLESEGLNRTQVTPSTVDDAFGLKVYTEQGVYIGEVDDIRLNFNQNGATGLALTNTNPELEEAATGGNQGVIVPYSWVNSVNDVVLTIDVIGRLEY